MIQPTLETPRLIAGQDQGLVIKIANTGPGACRGVVFRLHLPPEIIALRGEERIYLSELLPGAVSYLRLVVRPARPGSFLLASANFHYRDSRDRSVNPPQWRHQVVVDAPQLTSEQQAAQEAERHARAQRWEAAWPHYLQARDGRQAAVCLRKAVQRHQSQGDAASVTAQYLAYAQTVRQIGDPDLGNDVQVTRGLEQAIEWYLQAGQPAEAHRCRDLLGYLTRAPVLELTLDASGSAGFVAGVASLVTIEVTNRGYGPARHVRLKLDGAVERPDEWQLDRLGVGQTAVWQDACVVPTHPGQCVLRVQILVGAASSDAKSLIWHRATISVAPADLLGHIRGQGPGAAPLHIEKYFGSGTKYFDTGLVYTPARSRTKDDTIGSWSVVIDDVQDKSTTR